MMPSASSTFTCGILERLLPSQSQKIKSALPDGLSLVVIDEKTKEIVGSSVATIWHRDPARNSPAIPPETSKAKLLYNICDTLESHFWSLCPKNVNTVIRGEFLLIRSDLRRMKIGSLLTSYLKGKSVKMIGYDGYVGVATSYANLKNMEKMGAIPLAEISYEEYFKVNGIPFEGVFTDGTTKASLHFIPTEYDEHFEPKVLKIRCHVSKL